MAASSVWPVRIAALVALGLASALFFGAWQIISSHDRMTRVGIAVDGRMTGAFREVRGARGGPSLYPTISFRTLEGRVVIAQLEHSVERPAIRTGQVVPVRYDPASPDRVRLASEVAGGAGVLPWILIGLGLGVGTLGVFVLVRGRPARI